jgi:hypothetical protein
LNNAVESLVTVIVLFFTVALPLLFPRKVRNAPLTDVTLSTFKLPEPVI